VNCSHARQAVLGVYPKLYNYTWLPLSVSQFSTAPLPLPHRHQRPTTTKDDRQTISDETSPLPREMFNLNAWPLGAPTAGLKYPILAMNAVMIAWATLMNYSFVHPTAKATMWLRNREREFFAIAYIALCCSSAFIGLINVCYAYTVFTKANSVRMKKLRNAATMSCCRSVPVHKAIAAVILVFLGSYGLISSLAFRDLLVGRAYEQACSGYLFMAEVYVNPDFPSYNGTLGSPVQDASSTIKFFKDGHLQYTMDLVRPWNRSLGFDSYNRDLQMVKDYDWGVFELALRVADVESPAADTSEHRPEYFNTTKLVENQSKGLNTTLPGPIARVHYNLRNLTYTMTFTNTSAPGFPAVVKSGPLDPSKTKMAFPEFRLEQSDSDEWRFTDHICLPPRVGMHIKYHLENAIHGGFALGCRHYR